MVSVRTGTGPFRTKTNASTSPTALAAAATEKAAVQPAACSSRANGNADATCPSCPRLPVHCEICGRIRPLNHIGSRRITEMKVIASPAPTSTRPTIAGPIVGDTATTTCPTVSSSAPSSTSRRGPIRSSAMPTGICSPA